MAGPRQRQIVIAGDTINSFREKVNLIAEDVGATDRLTTTEDSDLVGAINEHDAELGTITSVAMGTTASTVSTAIAELDGRLDSINGTLLNTPKLWVRDSAATSYLHGNVQLNQDLNVRLNTTLAGNLVANGNVDLGDSTTDTISMTGRVDTNIVPSTDNARDLGSSSLEFRNLYVDGIGYIDSVQADNINVVSNVTLGGDLIVGDSARVAGNFSVGSAAIIGTDLAVNDDLYVGDSARIIGNLSTGGNTIIGGTLNVASNVEIGGTLTVEGVVNFKAGSSGSVTLGDANTDNVVFNADVNSSIIPNTDNTYDLGSSSQEWRHVYIDGTANIDNIAADSATISNNLVVGGTLSANGDVDLGNATTDTISMTGRIDTDIVPSTDNSRSLGSSTLEFKDLYIDGIGYIDGITADSATIGTLKVSDLTNNRVLIAGASGEVEDDSNFTFNGTTLTVGNTTIHRLTGGINTTGLEADSATITGDLDVQGITTLDSATVDGTLTTTGTATFNSNVLIQNDLRIEDSATITGNLRVVGNITSDSRAFYIQADSAGTDQVNFGETIRVRGGEGIDARRDGSNGWYIDAEVATSSNLGVAKFNTANFAVSAAGDVTIKDGGVANAELVNSSITFADSTGGTAVALGGTVTFTGTANEINVTRDGSTFNIGLPSDVYIDSNLTVGNDFTVGGDLILAGETRFTGQYVNLLDSVTGAPVLNAGISINRGTAQDAQLIWDEGNDYWKASYNNTASTLSQLITAANIDNSTLEFTSGTVKVKNNGIALGTKTTGNYIATIAGTANEVEVSGSGTETAAVTIGLPNSVTITNTLTASNLVASDSATIGTKLTTADLVVSDSAYIGGTLTVGGNFRVAGTTTTVNTETVTIDDNIIVLNNNATGPATENAGIEVERGDDTNVQLLWNEVSNRWTVAGAATGTLAYTSEIGDATITLTAGTDLSTGGNFTTNASSNKTVTFNHADITRTNSTTTASPAIDSSFTVIDSITTNARGHITAVNTKTVTLSSTNFDNYVSWTLSGDGGTPQTIASGNTVDIAGGTYITTTASATDTLTVAHDTTTRTNNTSTASPAHGGTFTAIDSITTNSTGHITAVNTKTITLPAGDDYISWTAADSDGTTYTITSADTLTIRGDQVGTTTNFVADDVLQVSHAATSALSGAQGSAGVSSITVDQFGHVTAVSTTTYDNYSSWTARDSDGTTYTITSGDTLTIQGGNHVGINTNFVADDVLQISHADTSTQASVNNTGGNYIQDVTLDGFGHVTALTSTQVAYANVSGTPTIGDATITISAGTGLTTGGNFTTNATANKTITLAVDYGTSLLIKNSAGTTLKTIKGVA